MNGGQQACPGLSTFIGPSHAPPGEAAAAPPTWQEGYEQRKATWKRRRAGEPWKRRRAKNRRAARIEIVAEKRKAGRLPVFGESKEYRGDADDATDRDYDDDLDPLMGEDEENAPLTNEERADFEEWLKRERQGKMKQMEELPAGGDGTPVLRGPATVDEPRRRPAERTNAELEADKLAGAAMYNNAEAELARRRAEEARNFTPHYMYPPDGRPGLLATTFDEHTYYNNLGYSHQDPREWGAFKGTGADERPLEKNERWG